MSDNINSRTARRKNIEAERTKKNGKNKNNAKSMIKKLFLTLVIIGFAILIGGAGLFAFYASSAPDLDEKLLKDPLSSEILDKNLDVIYKSGVEKREFVPYNEIPDLMQDAILATEDVRFYSHHGMDFWRLGGAVLANFRSGFGSQGASTLTQQVIKNSFLSDEKTLKRKAQEAWLAHKLESKYEKEEIFEMYFNKILMSGNNYGFGTAADHFYGKKLNELELHEIAMLAGLPQSPNGYNPFNNPERAEKRRNIVLGLMYQHKKITKAEMDAAKIIPVTSTLLAEDKRKVKDNTKYAAFVDIVLAELEDAGMKDVLSDGVTIHTNLDPAVQQSVENALKSDIFANDKMQGALTVLDTKTGGIVAIGGGRNFSTGLLNFASAEKRQPGSAIKPIIDYGPAIEYLNWSTGQTLHDVKYNYKDSKPAQPVRNVDRKYKGAITMREALSNSRNVPAVKTYEEVGRKKAVDFAAKLGLNFANEYPSNALGGTDEFSTVEIAGAYTAFGNGGIYSKPHSIKKIVFRDGKTERNMTPEPVVVMKDSTAYMITDILRDVFTGSGTAKRAAIHGLDVAGKTGTTNFAEKEGAKDSWFAGYTTDYTIAAWGGYQDRSAMESFEGERYVPQDLFKQVMSSISTGNNTARFKKPSSVEEATIQYGSDPLVLASASTPRNLKRTELFVRGTVPVEVAKEVVIELESPTSLTANYDAESSSVGLNWSHNAPDSNAIEGEVEFTVLVGVDGGEMQEMTTTKDSSVTFSGAESGRTYTFSVIAKLGGLQSSPATTTVQIEEVIEEVPEVDEEIIVPANPDDGNGNNGTNGNNPDDGNNSNNPDNGTNGNNPDNGTNGNNPDDGNSGNNPDVVPPVDDGTGTTVPSDPATETDGATDGSGAP
jgi:penicillin-binding protein 1A